MQSPIILKMLIPNTKVLQINLITFELKFLIFIETDIISNAISVGFWFLMNIRFYSCQQNTQVDPYSKTDPSI